MVDEPTLIDDSVLFRDVVGAVAVGLVGAKHSSMLTQASSSIFDCSVPQSFDATVFGEMSEAPTVLQRRRETPCKPSENKLKQWSNWLKNGTTFALK